MRPILFGSCLLLILFGQPASEPVGTVGVLPFENNSLIDRDTYAPLGKGLGAMISTRLSSVPSLAVVERVQLESALREIALGQTGIIDEASAPRVGEMVGADMLLLGSFMVNAGRLRIDVRLVEVETGKVVKAEQVEGGVDKVFRLTSDLTFKIVRELDIALDRREKKSLYDGGSSGLSGALLYSEGIALLEKGMPEQAAEKFRAALKDDPGFKSARTELEKLKTGSDDAHE